MNHHDVYDALNMTSSLDKAGNSFSYSYDDLNRLTQMQSPGSGLGPVVDGYFQTASFQGTLVKNLQLWQAEGYCCNTIVWHFLFSFASSFLAKTRLLKTGSVFHSLAPSFSPRGRITAKSVEPDMLPQAILQRILLQ